MQEYQVEWIIEVDAENEQDAARIALDMQQDPESLATVFEVYPRDENGRGDDCIEVDLPRALQARPSLLDAVRSAWLRLDERGKGESDAAKVLDGLLAKYDDDA